MLFNNGNIFVSLPHRIFTQSAAGFVVSSVENLLLGLNPEKFWESAIFPGKLSSPHRGTETWCYIMLYYRSENVIDSKQVKIIRQKKLITKIWSIKRNTWTEINLNICSGEKGSQFHY